MEHFHRTIIIGYIVQMYNCFTELMMIVGDDDMLIKGAYAAVSLAANEDRDSGSCLLD